MVRNEGAAALYSGLEGICGEEVDPLPVRGKNVGYRKTNCESLDSSAGPASLRITAVPRHSRREWPFRRGGCGAAL